MFAVDFTTGAETCIPLEAALVNEAIAYYQTAGDVFKRGVYKKLDGSAQFLLRLSYGC
jgi:hypothetical protein